MKASKVYSMILFVLICQFLVPVCGHASSTEPIQTWVARYNGSGNEWDVPRNVEIDADGYVYVTGGSRAINLKYDFLTIKYDQEGAEVWVARYNAAYNNNDQGYALVLDNLGNVYVTGSSEGSGTGSDYRDFTTVKYDLEGNILWVVRYNGPGNRGDVAYDIGSDASGNAYVTGESYSSDTGGSCTTIGYSPDGNELWVARLPYGSVCYSVALDDFGNIYVTGLIGDDFGTIKYDSEGNLIWESRYNGPANNHDVSTSIALDGQNNVYVTGRSLGDISSYPYYDYATIKYDSDGNRLWVSRYAAQGSGASPSSLKESLVVDESNNVYVTGESWNGINNDILTIKYDTSGNLLWADRYDGGGHDGSQSIESDNLGGIYVSGGSYNQSTSSNDYITIKYDASSGDPLWVAQYDGPANSGDATMSSCVDDAGDIYVTGYSIGTGTYMDYATIKYAQCTDEDEDTYYVEGEDCGEVDCDDSNPNVNPGIPESCDNEIDDDCDGLTDCIDGGDPDCDCPTTCAGSAEASTHQTNPVYGSTDLAKHLAFLLIPIGAVIVVRILRRKR